MRMIAARTLIIDGVSRVPELCLVSSDPITAVRVHIRNVLVFVQNPSNFLAVMHARVGHVVLSDQACAWQSAFHVVLVSLNSSVPFLVHAHPCLLPVFRRVFLQAPGLCRLHVIIFVAYYALFWEPARFVASTICRRERCSPSASKCWPKTPRTVPRSTGLRHRFPKSPQRPLRA